MARVKNRGRPKTSRPEREPSHNKTVAHDRDGKAGRTIPGRRARIVIGKEKDRKMIKRPHQSADQSNSGKPDHFRQLRNQKSAPRSEERRVGKSVDLVGRRINKKKKQKEIEK